MMANTGRCLCGAITYTISGSLRPVVYCHCEQCRKTSGHHVAATSSHRDNIKIIGEVRWFSSSKTAKRGFCPTCGSNLFWDGGGKNISIHTGSLENTSRLSIAGHIFVADKAEYFEITDGFPQAKQNSAHLTTKVPSDN